MVELPYYHDVACEFCDFLQYEIRKFQYMYNRVELDETTIVYSFKKLQVYALNK